MIALAIITLTALVIEFLWDVIDPSAMRITYNEPARVIPTVISSMGVVAVLLTLIGATPWIVVLVWLAFILIGVVLELG